MTHVHQRRDPRALGETVHERPPQDVVGNLAPPLKVDRDDGFVVPVGLVARLVFLLTPVAGEVEEEDVASSNVIHEPCECLGDVFDGGLVILAAVVFVGEEEHVRAVIGEAVALQQRLHIFSIIDASTERGPLADVIDTDDEGLVTAIGRNARTTARRMRNSADGKGGIRVA